MARSGAVKVCGSGCSELPMHGMGPAGVRVVVDVVREHGPDLPGMFVGDGDQQLAVEPGAVQALPEGDERD